MPRKKDYLAKREYKHPGTSTALIGREAKGRLDLTRIGGHDLIVPLGVPRALTLVVKGQDALAEACLDALAHVGFSGTRSLACLSGAVGGFKTFLRFLTSASLVVHTPNGVRPIHIGEFCTWLKKRVTAGQLTVSTARGYYQQCKFCFVAMNEYGQADLDIKKLFPRGVMENTNRAANTSTAYSPAEFSRIAAALRDELIDIHHGRIDLYPSEVMTAYLLVLLIRTGANLAPLLTMRRDAMRDGLMPGFKRILVRKRRSHKVLEFALREGAGPEDEILVPVDAVAVLERALRESEGLLVDAPLPLHERVWIYRSLNGNLPRRITCLSPSLVLKNLSHFARRRQIIADDGRALVVSPRRVRQTVAATFMRLTKSDTVLTSALLGNTPKVVDQHYSALDSQLQIAAGKVFGDELAQRLRGKFIPILTEDQGRLAERTPTARCMDPIGGELAPGGRHCALFTHCLFCRSFAIVGDSDDLWRLFSFQAFANEQLKYTDSIGDSYVREKLKTMYTIAIAFIDEFANASFGRKLVRKARKKAQTELHPFWKHEAERAIRLRSARGGAK